MSTGAASRPVALLLALSLVPAGAARADDERAAIEWTERRISEARSRFAFVRDLVERGDSSSVEWARQRFSEAETQFLLDNYEVAAALLMDALDVKAFRSEPAYAQALFYLGESLYQTQAWPEAKRYFKEAISLMPPGRQYQDAIVRLIDLADRTGDRQGIDGYFEAARSAGNLRPEVVYLYAKWTAHRRDLPAAERLARADAEFARLRPEQPYYPQARYFRGVLAIDAGRLDDAAACFREVADSLQPAGDDAAEEATASTAKDPRGARARRDAKLRRLRDLANMALARVYYEQNKTAEAVERYGRVAHQSEDYDDALFETAATFVRMGSYEQALRTSDILLIIGKDSPVTPEAKILQANLQLKLGKYDVASATFQEIVSFYGPVQGQITAMLQRPDPVRYFNELLEKGDRSLDITQLLPRPAVPFATTSKEVEDARKLAAELSQGRAAAEEAQKKATELIDTLDQGKLSLFPQLQEANASAVALSNQLLDYERMLLQQQERLLGSDVPDEVRREITRLETERRDLDEKFKQLPKTQEQYEERRAAFSKKINAREREAFKVRKTIDTMMAQVNGLETWVRNSPDPRTPEQEAEALSTIAQYRQLIKQFDDLRAEQDRQIKGLKVTLAAEAAGGQLEDDFRARYRKQLQDMQALVARVIDRAPAENRPLLGRVDKARVDIEDMQTELARLRGKLRTRALERADEYRKLVGRELARLEDFQAQVAGVEGSTRELLGEIAYNSFSRVGRQFYDIVLKADVGLVDVAWSRKKERSDKIGELARDKDEQLRRLQEQFKEVLTQPD